MEFPTPDALAGWTKATVSHGAWDDWFNELEGTSARDEKVAARLKRIARGHDPKAYVLQEVTLEQTRVHLLFDAGEDGFRETAGDFAALVRTATAHGAKGTFWFLGTAGAEGDFCYQLALDGKKSKLKELEGKALDQVYAGERYAAFLERLMALFEAGNPDVARDAAKARAGAKATSHGSPLHAQVMAALAGVPDAKLAATAQRFPGFIPDGKKKVAAGDLFRTASGVRPLLTSAPNEELRGVALWVLGELDPKAATPLALEASASNSLPLQVAALHVFGRAGDDDTALSRLLEHFTREGPLELKYAALAALKATPHPRLVEHLRGTLATAELVKSGPSLAVPEQLLLSAIRQRALKALAPEVAKFAISKANRQARMEAGNCLLDWKEPNSLATLAKALDDDAVGAHAKAARKLQRK